MRRWSWMLLGWLVAGSAMAGPTLSKSMLKDVPAEVAQKGEAMRKEIEPLDAKSAALAQEAEQIRGSVRIQKLEIDAAAAELDATRERRKVAKKAKDKAQVSSLDAEIDRIEQKIADLEAKLALSGEEADLLEAEAALYAAEAEMKRCDVEVVLATSLLDSHPDLDPNKYIAAQTKAQIAYQEARSAAASAEAKYVAHGGVKRDVGARDVTDTLSTAPPAPEPAAVQPGTPAPAPAAQGTPAPEPQGTPAPAPAPR